MPTTTAPIKALKTGLSATSSTAAAPVKASSAMPCTAKATPRIITHGPMRPRVIATSAPASSAADRVTTVCRMSVTTAAG